MTSQKSVFFVGVKLRLLVGVRELYLSVYLYIIKTLWCLKSKKIEMFDSGFLKSKKIEMFDSGISLLL